MAILRTDVPSSQYKATDPLLFLVQTVEKTVNLGIPWEKLGEICGSLHSPKESECLTELSSFCPRNSQIYIAVENTC